jgi:hypothetical protein
MSDAGSDWRKPLWDEANRIRIDSIYSGRGHQVVAQRWSLVAKLIGLPAAVLSAVLSSTAALTALLGAQKEVTASFALVASALISARAFLRPDELAEAHGRKGNEHMNVASDATRVQDVDLRFADNGAEIKGRLEELAERRNALRLKQPRIPRWAYEKAKKSILAGESHYEGDYLWRDWSP